jgi:hypothetical protein
MSQTNATTGVASSGNRVGLYRGRKTTGEQVLGKEDYLGNVVGLLRQQKQMVFASRGVQHPFWTLQIIMRGLLAINQGP